MMVSHRCASVTVEEGLGVGRGGQSVDALSMDSVESPTPEVHTALKRKLKNRHVAMISISGVIGTGLFLGTATSLMNGGPVGILLGYVFLGTICFATMISLGEMAAFLPIPGGFIKLAERFVNPAFAFAVGWNYWYQWTMTLPTELAAAAALIQFWDEETSPAVWITGCLVVAIGINALGVGAYGEAEFCFSIIKVVTIVGLIVLGIVVDLGGGPNHDRIGFRHWKTPGPFANYKGFTGPKGHFLGTWSILIPAAFAYFGTEAVAMAAAEVRNPRSSIPKAIKRVYLRVLIFYIGGVFVIGLLVPSDNPLLNLDSNNASASPFVIAFNKAGIQVLPSIINAAILTSAWSASSSDLYLSTRSLYGLAVSGSAPKIFSRTTRNGLPHVAFCACSCFAFLAYMTLGHSSGTIFTWLSGFCATAGLVTWFGIGVTYLRFYEGMRVQGIDRRGLPYASRLQPYAGWWCVGGSGIVLVFGGCEVFIKGQWSPAFFVTRYFPPLFFPLLYAAAKLATRRTGPRTVSPEKMDFTTNVAEIDALLSNEPPPRNKFEAVWRWLL